MTLERQTWQSCGCSFCRGIRAIATLQAAMDEKCGISEIAIALESADPEVASAAPPEEAPPEARAPGSGAEAP